MTTPCIVPNVTLLSSGPCKNQVEFENRYAETVENLLRIIQLRLLCVPSVLAFMHDLESQSQSTGVVVRLNVNEQLLLPEM